MNTAVKKTALVTGASSGIGRASALALAAAGYDVAICGRRKDALDATVALHSGSTGSVTAFVADLSTEEGANGLFDDLKKTYSRLDVLFNNAGMSGRGSNFGDCTFENWRKVLNINLDGMFLCSNLAFRWMRDQDPQGGRIINNGSISAHVPRPGSAPYTASKHGVTGLTRSISLDGRQYNIACGQIDIGNAASEMTADFAKGLPQADGSVKPEPTIDVNHIANAVAHMAGLPPEANVQFMTIMATNMPFIGRG
ncbi:MAG: SDR family oxidoreductase [Rhizobiales bacterium]|nr:SDR family oxidoreductase [Hyphomicrobiales bacterium]